MFTPHTPTDEKEMLAAIGAGSLDELLAQIPSQLLHPALALPKALTEAELTAHAARLAAQNKPLKNFIGAGCYEHFIPAAVGALASRGEFLTAYTPYQAEASQGTLQTIYEFQSSICALFDMEVATASHYDGATALAEAVLASLRITGRSGVLVPAALHPHYKQVLLTYLHHLSGVTLQEVAFAQDGTLSREQLEKKLDAKTACFVLAQPNFLGALEEASVISEQVHAAGALLIAQVNPLSLGVLQTPGAYGADFAVAEGQPLGNALNFGGPGLGILTARKQYMRQLPGRMVGLAQDKQGRRAFVLTLQAREQHIRREKAASNICSNEALCALNAVIYLTLLGPQGLREVAQLNIERAHQLAQALLQVKGYRVLTRLFFNEFVLECPVPAQQVVEKLAARGIGAGYALGTDYPGKERELLVCATELRTAEDVSAYAQALGEI